MYYWPNDKTVKWHVHVALLVTKTLLPLDIMCDEVCFWLLATHLVSVNLSRYVDHCCL